MDKTPAKISFFCKLRSNATSISSESQLKLKDKRSVSPHRSKSPFHKTPNDNSQSIFTPISENETCKIVVANENPIKQKFISSYFRTEKDLFNYKNTILKNAKIFSFDGVFDRSYKYFFFLSLVFKIFKSNELLYQILYKEKVCNMINGLSSTFFYYGPKG